MPQNPKNRQATTVARKLEEGTSTIPSDLGPCAGELLQRAPQQHRDQENNKVIGMMLVQAGNNNRENTAPRREWSPDEANLLVRPAVAIQIQ